MRLQKPLIITLGLFSFFAAHVCAESPVNGAVAPTPAPANKLPMPTPVGPRSLIPPQPSLTPEENTILSQAHSELQKDPELQELNLQIKTLMEKRAKLAEEKLQKISPEAALILQKVKANQDKMQAERRAQMEALQAAKRKAAQEKESSETPSHKAEPAPTPSPAPAVPNPTP